MTETIQKEPDHEEKETKITKKAEYWDDLNQKGKRDAEVKELGSELARL